jgi:hypothetical protein
MLDKITKANKVVEAALAAERAACQAVLDAEKALTIARDARFAAGQRVKEAMAVASKICKTADGEAATKNIDWSQAKSSYSGAAGKCCCGCAGNHSESGVAIKRQINRIKRLAGEGVTLDVQPTYVAAEQNDRLYIVYFNG